MELEYTRVEAFEVKGIRFTCASKWNGMEEWKDDKGRKMIVARGYEGGLRDYQHAYARVRRVKHADRLNAERRAYVARNRAQVTNRQNEWAKKKLRSDPMFALKKRIRSLIGNAFASVGSSKNQETQAILGCTFEEFKAHIERQFLPGMSWERMGREIHIDHIVPLATATCEQDVIALNHFTNLRPMWATDNISKGAKVLALL